MATRHVLVPLGAELHTNPQADSFQIHDRWAIVPPLSWREVADLEGYLGQGDNRVVEAPMPGESDAAEGDAAETVYGTEVTFKESLQISYPDGYAARAQPAERLEVAYARIAERVGVLAGELARMDFANFPAMPPVTQ